VTRRASGTSGPCGDGDGHEQIRSSRATSPVSLGRVGLLPWFSSIPAAIGRAAFFKLVPFVLSTTAAGSEPDTPLYVCHPQLVNGYVRRSQLLCRREVSSVIAVPRLAINRAEITKQGPLRPVGGSAPAATAGLQVVSRHVRPLHVDCGCTRQPPTGRRGPSSRLSADSETNAFVGQLPQRVVADVHRVSGLLSRHPALRCRVVDMKRPLSALFGILPRSLWRRCA
jgi:hypothetical protein